jgi:hypothetical protein
MLGEVPEWPIGPVSKGYRRLSRPPTKIRERAYEGWGGQGHLVSENRIFGNDKWGIELVTPTNNNQQPPRLTSATLQDGQLTITGVPPLPGNPYLPHTVTLEFFGNDICATNVQGQHFLGSQTIPTTDLPHDRFAVTLDVHGMAIGHYITATATDTHNDTSPFSLSVPVTRPMLDVTALATAPRKERY